METYHGYPYTLDEFDRTDAFGFILNHFVFMDTDERPVSLQHDFITAANDVVDEMEKSHILRKAYYAHALSVTKITRLSLISALLGAATIFFALNATQLSTFLAVVGCICLLIPVCIMTRSLGERQEVSLEMLSSIHSAELTIASIMSLAGLKNSVSMTEQYLSSDGIDETVTRTLN